jgi:hypothetical protein
LDRAEKGLNAAIEALNNQMIAAIEAVTQIVKTRGDGGNAVVRTAPIDRATSMFRRLIEVVDNQLANPSTPCCPAKRDGGASLRLRPRRFG